MSNRAIVLGCQAVGDGTDGGLRGIGSLTHFFGICNDLDITVRLKKRNAVLFLCDFKSAFSVALSGIIMVDCYILGIAKTVVTIFHGWHRLSVNFWFLGQISILLIPAGHSRPPDNLRDK